MSIDDTHQNRLDGRTEQTTFDADSDRGDHVEYAFTDERTGPAGEKCACLPSWIDAYEAGDDPLMCFPCHSELRRRRREIDRLADHYPESVPNRGEDR